MDTNFLDKFVFGDGWLAIAVGHPTHLEYYSIGPDLDLSGLEIPSDKDVYFGPAMRLTE